MKIAIKLLNKCPVLTAYEKDLIRWVDIKGETQASVAERLGKTPGTISIQHKKALEKYRKYKKKSDSPHEGNLDRYVFERLNRGDTPSMIIADIGEASKVIALSEKWRKLHTDDYWSVRKLLDSFGIMNHVDEGGQKPLTEGVEVLIDWWDETQQMLFKEMDKKKATIEELEKTEKKLSDIEDQLARVELKVQKLERLKKYEALSEEERNRLVLEIAATRGVIRDLRQDIVELQNQKASLEREVDVLKEIIFDLYTKTRETVKEYLARMDIKDAWKLVIEAKFAKKNPTAAKFLKSQV